MIDAIWYVVALVGGAAGTVGALFVHEFAHAVPLLLAGGSVHVTLGSDSGWTVRLGRLTVTFGVDGMRKLVQYGRYEPQGTHSVRVYALSIAAGPAATVAIVSLLGALLYRGVDGPLSFGLTFVLLSELSRAVQTIVPKTYSRGPYAGTESDGKRFLRLVRS